MRNVLLRMTTTMKTIRRWRMMTTSMTTTSQIDTNELKCFDAMLFLLIRRPTSPT